MLKVQVREGFGKSEVQIVRSGRLRKIDLGNATKQQLEYLLKMKHPAVEEAPKRTTKKS